MKNNNNVKDLNKQLFSGAVKVLRNSYIRYLCYVAILINLLNWLSSYYIVSRIDHDLMILHYNVKFGIDYIGEVGKIYNFPLVGFIVILVNLSIYLFSKRDYKFLGYTLLVVSILVNIFILMSLGPIYLINLS
ncbi:hypothetical protein ISS03_00835 [Patescibacteria group bacterium]|nr:hypothetical protein [Patescibacteria group bacterium]